MKWEVILLAAGKLEKDFIHFQPLPSKAYIPIEGRPMAQRVLDPLKSISYFQRFITVIPCGASAFDGTISVKGGDTIIESMARGFDTVNPDTEMVLLATCDLPCLTQAGVEDFCSQVEEYKAGLSYGFVSKEDSERKYPGIPHTYISLKEGTFCGSGLFAIKPQDFPKLKSFADKATQYRKNIFKLAGILGFTFILKLILKQLSLNDAEKRATELLGFPAKGIPSRFPEIAFNVDNLRSLELVQAILQRGASRDKYSTTEDLNC